MITASFLLRKSITTAILVLPFAGIFAQQRSLLWQWPNMGCQNMIHCDTGCSACDVPQGNDGVLIGTNGAYVGVSACPHPFSDGDNAIFSEGWDVAVKEDRMIIYSAVALTSLSIDSIQVRHRSWGNGPQYLKISIALGLDGNYSEVYDGPIDAEFTTLLLQDLGQVSLEAGAAMTGLQIKFQAYGGGTEGAWVLDEMRMATSEIPTIVTGVPELRHEQRSSLADPVDLLGRAIGNGGRTGAYIDRQRRIVVVQ